MINKDVYKFIGSSCYKLKTSDSWRGRKDVSCTFTKEEKEALNAMTFFILLTKRQVEEGKVVNWDACIAYIIKRIIRKALTWDSKPENKADIIVKFSGYKKCEADYVHNQFLKATNPKFVEFIDQLALQISEEEEKLFMVAKNHCNLVEFSQVKHVIFEEDIEKIDVRLKYEAMTLKLENYISNELNMLTARLSWARNVVRWQGYGNLLACNILCHMLETAIFAWLMAIETNTILGVGKYCPHQAFVVGLFHDVAEIWTDDIPSPCKDRIMSEQGSIRAITEQQEVEALAKYFYVALSEPVAKYFKNNFMLDELEDEDFHKFMKKADYFSADYEIYWNIVLGLRHVRYKEILETSANVENRTPAIVDLLKVWLDKLKDVVFLEP